MAYYFYLFILLLINFSFVNCNESQNCDKNFEQKIKYSKNDYVGKIIVLLNPIFNNFKKFSSLSPQFCQTTPFLLGTAPFKFSLRPRGCCRKCCFVDNADNYVQIKFWNKNKKVFLLKLSSEKQKGKLAAFGVKKELPTILFIHGFGENALEGRLAKLMVKAYLSKNENYNFLQVDWGELASFPWYAEARDNTKLVAKSLADFFEFYHTTGDLSIENLHIIGLSLGAHTAGHVGKQLKKFHKVPRITGLDPAFPFYSLTDKTERLCEDDAEFVDVIHTNPGYAGIPVSIGDADFYVNRDQKIQPGCDFNTLAQKDKIVDLIFCDHVRSVELFAESVMNPKAFPVFTVDSQTKKRNFVKNAYMGFLANNSTTMGDFYVTTNYGTPNYRPLI